MKRVLIFVFCLMAFGLMAQVIYQPHRRNAFRSILPDTTGLKIWLKSESLSGSEGSAVNNWPDSSGNGWYFTNATAANCPYVTNTFGGVAGVKALYFSSKSLWVSNSAAFSVAKNIGSASMIVVAYLSDNAAVKTPVAISKNSAGLARNTIQGTATEAWTAGGRTADADSYASVTCPTGGTLGPMVIQADFLHSTGDCYLYTNNVEAASTTSWHTDGNTSATDSVHINLGTSGSTEAYLGGIAEVLYFVPAISASVRTQWWTYLKAKVGQ